MFIKLGMLDSLQGIFPRHLPEDEYAKAVITGFLELGVALEFLEISYDFEISTYRKPFVADIESAMEVRASLAKPIQFIFPGDTVLYQLFSLAELKEMIQVLPSFLCLQVVSYFFNVTDEDEIKRYHELSGEGMDGEVSSDYVDWLCRNIPAEHHTFYKAN